MDLTSKDREELHNLAVVGINALLLTLPLTFIGVWIVFGFGWSCLASAAWLFVLAICCRRLMQYYVR